MSASTCPRVNHSSRSCPPACEIRSGSSPTHCITPCRLSAHIISLSRIVYPVGWMHLDFSHTPMHSSRVGARQVVARFQHSSRMRPVAEACRDSNSSITSFSFRMNSCGSSCHISLSFSLNMSIGSREPSIKDIANGLRHAHAALTDTHTRTKLQSSTHTLSGTNSPCDLAFKMFRTSSSTRGATCSLRTRETSSPTPSCFPLSPYLRTSRCSTNAAFFLHFHTTCSAAVPLSGCSADGIAPLGTGRASTWHKRSEMPVSAPSSCSIGCSS
mmetsp:Transcript_52256/g.127671  ORF Transcript_52256/g.127671 Transcript_52256/m.127671 type:complete len:271 (+) Transcript_52256:1184-1996(+)